MMKKNEQTSNPKEPSQLDLISELQYEGKKLEGLCIKSDTKAVEILSKIATYSLAYAEDKPFNNIVNSKLKSHGLNMRKTDSLSDKLVKLIFGTTRRSRNLVYRRVLNEGLKQSKTGDSFSEWVSLNGGMEKIAYKGECNKNLSRKFIEAGKEFAEAHSPLTSFQADFIQPKYSGTLVFLGNAHNGKIDVICTLANKEINNRVFGQMGKCASSSGSLAEIRKKLLEDDADEIYWDEIDVDEHLHDVDAV